MALKVGHGMGGNVTHRIAVNSEDLNANFAIHKGQVEGPQHGYGQLVLLPDHDVLLMLSEKGELALVKRRPIN